jgi:hypothetical protein
MVLRSSSMPAICVAIEHKAAAAAAADIISQHRIAEQGRFTQDPPACFAD